MNANELDVDGFGIGLIEGEHVDMAVGSNGEDSRRSWRTRDVLLLTNRRVIQIGGGHSAKAALIGDIESVEIVPSREGYSAFAWAGVSVVLSLVLYSMIDHSLGKIAAPLIVLGMGIYLIVNRMIDSGQSAVVFRTAGSEIEWHFDAKRDVGEVRQLVNRLFCAKLESKTTRWFAPR